MFYRFVEFYTNEIYTFKLTRNFSILFFNDIIMRCFSSKILFFYYKSFYFSMKMLSKTYKCKTFSIFIATRNKIKKKNIIKGFRNVIH